MIYSTNAVELSPQELLEDSNSVIQHSHLFVLVILEFDSTYSFVVF